MTESEAPQLQAHPVAALFPLMEGGDFAALVEDVLKNGLLQPIWLHRDGTILDGRNRYRACLAAGIEAQFKTWAGPDSGIVQLVTSLNLRRRHLTEEQRAFIAADLASMTGGRPEKPSPTEEVSERPLVSRTEAASVMQVKPAALDRARTVAKHAPELKEKVLSGDMSLTAAAKKAADKKHAADAEAEEKRGRETDAVEKGREVLKKKREAERLALIEAAARKLRSWLESYGEAAPLRSAASHVRVALAALDEER